MQTHTLCKDRTIGGWADESGSRGEGGRNRWIGQIDGWRGGGGVQSPDAGAAAAAAAVTSPPSYHGNPACHQPIAFYPFSVILASPSTARPPKMTREMRETQRTCVCLTPSCFNVGLRWQMAVDYLDHVQRSKTNRMNVWKSYFPASVLFPTLIIICNTQPESQRLIWL